MEPVLVGKVGKPHGLDGSVVVHAETDNPERFGRGASMHLESGEELTIDRVRSTETTLLVSFLGVDDRDAAERLRGLTLWIDESDRRDLGVDEYWPEDLIGLEVRDPAGTTLGSIVAVDADSPQNRLTIATARGEFIVPLVTALVPEVNQAGGYVVVEPIEGLLDP
jgi:16S rRNA processing protein RimM